MNRRRTRLRCCVRRTVLATATFFRLWGLWVQIGINQYLSMRLSGIQKTDVPQGFGAY